MKYAVSIIMPCHNSGEFVRAAVESVLRQNVPVQLIAVDDGSIDNTLDILDSFSSDITVLQTSHQGVAHARNSAIPEISARYTLLLDSDDALAPGSLKYLLDRISPDESEVVYGNISSWDKSMQKKLHVHKPAILGISPLSILVNRNISPPGAILFPTDAFNRVGSFDQSVASCEDWDFVIRLARVGYRFTALNREVFYYRRLLASASNQVTRMLASGLEVVRRCHYGDSRVIGDLYADGYQNDRIDLNLFYYHAACLGLAVLSPTPNAFQDVMRSIKVPLNVNWVEFRRIFCQSIWWNSLAVDGDQSDLVLEAQARGVSLIKLFAGDQKWHRDMVLSILSPDFRQLLLRPGPKKALRLFREWRMARQIAGQINPDSN